MLKERTTPIGPVFSPTPGLDAFVKFVVLHFGREQAHHVACLTVPCLKKKCFQFSILEYYELLKYNLEKHSTSFGA